MRSRRPLPAPRALGRALSLALGLSLALAVPAVGAGAQNLDPAHRSELVRQIGEASKAETAALSELGAIQAQRAALETKVRELTAEVVVAQANVERITARWLALVDQLNRTRYQLLVAERKFQGSAAEMYRTARRGSEYDWVLAAAPREVLAGNRYLDHVSSQRRELVTKISELRDDLDVEQQAADAEKQAATAEQARVEGLRAQQQSALDAVAAQQVQEQAALTAIRAKKDDYQRELAAIQAASEAIARALAVRSAGKITGGKPCATRSVPGAIVSGFGTRVHPILGTARMHAGVDLAASTGDPIKACLGGTVVIAGWQDGYGNTTVIDHGGGMATLYGHQSKLGVKVGETVSAGQVIGEVGSTGMSTGPHLHFEVRLGGKPVDPAPYL